MDCRNVRDAAHEYHDGALPPAERAAVEKHAAACPACASTLARARKLEELLARGWRVPEPPRSYWDAMRSRLVSRTRPRHWIGVAAAAALAAALTLALWPSAPPPDVSSAPAPPAPPVRPPQKEFRPVLPPAPEPTPEPDRSPLLPSPRDPAPAPEPSPTQDHVARMTEESLEIGLATTASERVRGFFKAADARLAELGDALADPDESLVEELASAYVLLLREGVAAVLQDPDDPAPERTAAGEIARLRAGRNAEALADLERRAPEAVRPSVRQALDTSRELARAR